MAPGSLPLVERIVASLARAGSPVPGETLAEKFLGLRGIDRPTADRLLEPTLGADPRVERTASGWTLHAGGPDRIPEDQRLDAPGCAVFAPRAPTVAGVQPFGNGPARLLVALGGDVECGRARLRGAVVPDRPAVDLGSTLRLVRQVPGVIDDPVAAAEALMLAHVEDDTAPGRARILELIWHHVVADLAAEGIRTRTGLGMLLVQRLEEADLSGRGFGAAELAALEDRPGTYVFEDAAGAALYVGQSSCLRSRVPSYFCGAPRDAKDREIRRRAFRLDARATDTALDARIAEAALIRRRRPELNTQRDVHIEPPEDGILLVRGPERLVAFVVRDGALAGRFATAGGAGRVRRLAGHAVAALAGETRCRPGDAARRAAALVASWLRSHPGAAWFTPAGFGPAPRIRQAIVSAAREADLPAGRPPAARLTGSSESARGRPFPRD